VKRALQEPLRQIAENAAKKANRSGQDYDSKDNNFGYNALTGEYEDLVKAGVLDPTRSCALPCRCRINRFVDAHYRGASRGDPRRRRALGRTWRHGAVWETCTKLAISSQKKRRPRSKERAFCCSHSTLFFAVSGRRFCRIRFGQNATRTKSLGHRRGPHNPICLNRRNSGKLQQVFFGCSIQSRGYRGSSLRAHFGNGFGALLIPPWLERFFL